MRVAESTAPYHKMPVAESGTERVAAVVAPRMSERLFTREEIERLIEAEFFDAEEKIELLDGRIYRLSPQGLPHSGTIQALTRLLFRVLGERAAIRVQLPFAAGERSRPEPDFAVVPPGRYLEALPEEAFLIIEVSDSTLRSDRELKAAVYAAHGVPEYWIVNLPESRIEVLSEPEEGRYRQLKSYKKGEVIHPAAFEDVTFEVTEILP